MDARSFVDAVARVEAHPLRGNAPQPMIDRLDVDLRRPPPLRGAQRRPTVEVGEEGVVDLKEEAGIDDRPVLGVHGLGDRVQVLLVRPVVLVRAHAARRHRGHEDIRGRESGQGRREIVDVPAHRLVSAIAHRPRARELDAAGDRAAGHGMAEVLLVVLREGGHLGGPARRASTAPGLETGQPLVDVREEAGLALLAVGRNVDAALDLPADDLGDGAPDPAGVGVVVVRLAGDLRLHQVEEVVRARQAAAVSGEDPIRAPGHLS